MRKLLLSATMLAMVLFIAISCKPTTVKNQCELDPVSIDSTKISNQQKELDNFYTLMAYAVVYKDWQTNALRDSSRGYNIGSVLVDKNNKVVHWARNSVNITNNESQHGEVRLMQSYLDQQKCFSLQNHTIYTTLEPCAMCSGMMKLTEVHRTVYGQTDPSYGKALERMQLNTYKACEKGYTPYPRPVISDKSHDNISEQIDDAYSKHPGEHITTFLATNEAKELFEKATEMFKNFDPTYQENAEIVEYAKQYYTTVSDSYVNLACLH